MFGGTLFMCFGIATIFSGQQGPVMQVARIIGAAADLSEHTTGVAVQALNATTQLASGATELFLTVASSGLTSGANLWRGVDLTGLHARRCAGQLLVDGDSTLDTWLNSTQAMVLIPCLELPLQQQLLAAGQTVGLHLPSAQTSTEELDLDGSYRAVRIWGSLHGSGRIQLQFDFVQVDFAPRWANPLWQQWQVPLDGEREQILRLLRQTVVHLPAPPIHAGQATLEIQAEISWEHVRDRLTVHVRGLSLRVSQSMSRVFQSGGLLNFLQWLDEHFWHTMAGVLLFIGFCATYQSMKLVFADFPARPLAIQDGVVAVDAPPMEAVESVVEKHASLEAALANSVCSSTSYVKVGSADSPASWSSISSKDSVELIGPSQVEVGF